MAAMAGILNHHQMTAGQALTGKVATPMASSTPGTGGTGSTDDSSSSDADSATISANDFLTLLVTEMQNQDPTADTDPNAYIDQLVQVNSLEQLIDINQNLSTALGDTSATPSSSTSPQAAGTTGGVGGAGPAVATAQAGAVAHKANALTSAQPAAPGSAVGGSRNQPTASAVDKLAPGNLGVPDATPAALRVAQALNGQSRKRSIAGGLSGAQ